MSSQSQMTLFCYVVNVLMLVEFGHIKEVYVVENCILSFPKTFLGLKSSTPNIMVYGELSSRISSKKALDPGSA